MKTIDFNLHIYGINDKTFSDTIMIYKPHISVRFSIFEYELSNNHIKKISDLLKYISVTYRSFVIAAIGNHPLDINKLYLKYDDYLLGFINDKTLSELFSYVNSDHLEFDSFFGGGASFHNDGYKFFINPSEKCHQNTPHVHVEKEGKTVRFYLKSSKPMDTLVFPHRKDVKKIIIPTIKKNKKKLMKWWKHYQNGYTTPTLSNKGKQHYPES